MSDQTLFLAIFLGSKDSARMKAWSELPDEARRAKEKEGIAAWHAWVEKHKASIVDIGGPLGKTRAIGEDGIVDRANALTGFTVVRCASHEEAAKMFEGHPHFAIFPGESVEVMPVLPIPGV
ncbi:YciI family protein [Paraburkholderia lycopersici]|uniref:YCII-related domain-containing protein n=1 Tax=Paraburkholderia lycopersici TaxID=416944 RepID=A0A1G7AL01_9BURK|nr:YciI family protein [Paraburkholderia lycopersici]SDE14685.1 YCII-related domain-containing protein [Paraburkholderia lycopersici]